MLLASQNLEDFDQEGIREMTKPLFSIPPHQFLFNPGSCGRCYTGPNTYGILTLDKGRIVHHEHKEVPHQ